jgi:hypothetical protein
MSYILYVVMTMATANTTDDLFAAINESTLSEEELIHRFRTTGFLWIQSNAKRFSSASDVFSFLDNYADVCAGHWSVENLGQYEMEQPLMDPKAVKDLVDSFYVSTIIRKSNEMALASLVSLAPPPPIPTATYNGGAWLFVGKNGTDSKKRKRTSLMGRAEHVDDVTHSGTWHYQLSGEKVWYIRPNQALWDMVDIPDISSSGLAEQTEKGTFRLKVQVQEGDIFMLNTRIWFHRTELESSDAWSMSIARDFYLPFQCPEDNVQEGDIILEEDDIPTDIPRSDNPNCALAEVDDEETGESCIVLIAISNDIRIGDNLCISEDNIEGEYNGAEEVDPRAIAASDFRTGDIVLRGDAIPDDVPRSMHPTCALMLDDDNEAILQALVHIQEGEIFSILPDEDEEYEDVEVDLETGELIRVQGDERSNGMN